VDTALNKLVSDDNADIESHGSTQVDTDLNGVYLTLLFPRTELVGVGKPPEIVRVASDFSGRAKEVSAQAENKRRRRF
jgi:hypothetical protein